MIKSIAFFLGHPVWYTLVFCHILKCTSKTFFMSLQYYLQYFEWSHYFQTAVTVTDMWDPTCLNLSVYFTMSALCWTIHQWNKPRVVLLNKLWKCLSIYGCNVFLKNWICFWNSWYLFNYKFLDLNICVKICFSW